MVAKLLAKLEGLRDSELKRRRFDLTVWNNGRDLHEVLPEAECGFAGCVVGWMGHERWFDEDGFRVEHIPMEMMSYTGEIRTYSRDREGVWHRNSFHGVDRYLGDFLGVEETTAGMIIYPENYPREEDITIDDVVERVSYLLENGEGRFVAKFAK